MTFNPNSASVKKVSKFKIFLTLFLLGLTGVFSLLLAPVNIPEGTELPLSLSTLKIIGLIQSSILLGIATFIGSNLSTRVGFSTPLIKAFYNHTGVRSIFSKQIIFGIIGGAIAYIFSAIILKLTEPFLPAAYLALNQNPDVQIPLLTRVLYGGIVEELLIRWGLMTFLVWLPWKIFQKASGTPKSIFYWFGITVAAAIFGIGHLPLLFSLIAQPTILLIGLIMALNMITGIIAGWLYWRKGLEAAIFAHMTFHLILVSVSEIIN
ncbi:CAAX amino terminal protease family [Rivularia sp. PCC 7116]|uniref:CPBP family intramembrane glutamic endopeptidase n=1 Tax=Rivularia sp. PCC 7116 TaxID=373994 RepID=UPI00029F4BF6|nr:CPBP family intramembrane glutamic endopeptidase [Rivularia sp. PCC 7116]AFY55476.1 CAAX amino terminal protease family [Rivularia sp. PCC 7116]